MEINGFIKGNCPQMCPKSEVIMREKCNLLHRLEMVKGTEKFKNPRADESKMVKSFSRSAAGQDMQKPECLRSPKVLLETVTYLLQDVIRDETYPFIVVYDFIMDRLRAVRQDMVIQDLQRAPTISLLQPIVRFYAFAGYRLCEEPINTYDPFFNNKHFLECIKKLLVLYDDCDLFEQRSVNLNIYEEIYCDDRPLIEAMYILHNLGNTTAIRRCLSLKAKWRTPLVENALHISLSYLRGNWVMACKLINDLPALLAAVASLHLPAIRRKAFLIMSTAYNSKNLYFPLDKLKDTLLYSSKKDLLNDLKYFNIFYKGDDAQFIKTKFDNTKKNVTPCREIFVENKLLEDDVIDIILYG